MENIKLLKAPLITFCIAIMVSSIAIFAVELNRIELKRKNAVYVASITGDKVEKTITEILKKTEILASLVVQSDGKVVDFEKVSSVITKDLSVRSVAVAPNGVVEYVYPLAGNEKLLGLDLLGDSDDYGIREAKLAKETEKLTFVGPYSSIQGGEILTGRLPVFIKDENRIKKFWGLVEISLYHPYALSDSYLDELFHEGYECEIWLQDPKTSQKNIVWNLKSENGVFDDPVDIKFNICNQTWSISIFPIGGWYNKEAFYTTIAFAIVLSLMLSFVVNHFYEVKRMKREMEEMAMTDMMTGLPNRRGLYKAIDENIDLYKVSGKKFVLCFIDIIGLKHINDGFGHKTGDKVIVEMSERVKKCIDANQVMARVGGDEFVLVLKDVNAEETQNNILPNIIDKLKMPFFVSDTNKDLPVFISLNYGIAEFPKDGKTTEPLMQHADKMLFEMKKANAL